MVVQRYFLRNLTIATLFICVALTMAIWLTQSLRFLELIVNSSAPLRIFLTLVLLSLPKFIEVILPVSLVAAVLFVYNRMIMDNEMVVLRASGASPLQLARPAIALALAMTVLLYGMTLWGTPAAHARMQYMRQLMKSEYSSFLLREGAFSTFGKGLTVFMRERAANGELRGIMLHDGRTAPPVIITAKSGQLVSSDTGPRVLVFNGTRQELDEKTGTVRRLDFDQYSVEIRDFQPGIRERWREPDERTIGELFRPDPNDKLDVVFRSHFVAEAHRRLTTPLYALTLALTGLCCLLLGPFNRRGQTRKILLAVFLVLALQGVNIGLASLAKKSVMAVPLLYLAALAPAALMLFLLDGRSEAWRRRLHDKARIWRQRLSLPAGDGATGRGTPA